MADEEDPAARTLADILREAGIDSTGRGGRRRAASAAPDVDPDVDIPAPAPAPATPDGAKATSRPPRRVLGALRLLLELVVAAVLGVVVYYTFGLLWDLYPYLGVAAAALVLAGLAAAGQWLRLRRGGGALPPLVLGAVLVVGAILTLLPAAEVLTR